VEEAEEVSAGRALPPPPPAPPDIKKQTYNPFIDKKDPGSPKRETALKETTSDDSQ